jgi:hypothetical protein
MNGTSKGFELMEPASPEALMPEHGLWPWFLVAAAVMVAVALLTHFTRRRKPFDSHAVRDAAFAEASAALAATATDNARNAAVQSSLILRKYLASAAGDPALFETHEEFVSRHDALLALTPEARAATETGFTRLAALKYAPEIPDTVAAEVVAESRALLETLHHGFAA